MGSNDSIHKPSLRSKPIAQLVRMIDFGKLQHELMTPIVDTAQENLHCNLISSFRSVWLLLYNRFFKRLISLVSRWLQFYHAKAGGFRIYD